MAKVAVPIIQLTYKDADAYDNHIMDVFEEEGVWNPQDEYTYTGRVSLDLHNSEEARITRDRIIHRLRTEMIEQGMLDLVDAEQLIALLDQHDWDVSFFVDTW